MHMKRVLFILFVIPVALTGWAQFVYKVPYYDWSSTTAFMLSPQPLITGYGPYSDSLSDANNGRIYYVYEDEYYPIQNWADYYYWYTKKYWYLFESPLLYEYYYITGNDLEMAKYIAGYYHGRYYPSTIVVDLGLHTKATNQMRTCRQIPYNDDRVMKLNRDLSFEGKRSLSYELTGKDAIIASNYSPIGRNQVGTKQRSNNQGTAHNSVSGTMSANHSATTTSKTFPKTQSGSLSAKHK